jgi:hypothetical protein
VSAGWEGVLSAQLNGSRYPDGEPVVRDDININHPQELIARHQGEHVAWSRDGRRVSASAAGMKSLFDEVDRLDLPRSDFVVGFIERVDEICFGPFIFRMGPVTNSD